MSDKLRPAARYSDLQARYNRLKNSVMRATQNNADLVTVAMMRGEPLILNRNAKGLTVHMGDEVIPKPEEYSLYLTMARQGGVITKQTQLDNAEYRRLKPILEKCEKPKQNYSQSLTEASEAAATLAGIESQMYAARARLEQAQQAAAHSEKELGKILDEAGIN